MGKKISRILDNLGVILFVLVIINVVIQIISRYIFHSPTIWTEELARYTFVWIVFVGAVMVMRDGEHIVVDVLINILPKKVKKPIAVTVKITSIIFLIVLAYFGFKMVIDNLNYTSYILHLPMWLIQACVPLASIGMIIYMIRLKEEE